VFDTDFHFKLNSTIFFNMKNIDIFKRSILKLQEKIDEYYSKGYTIVVFSTTNQSKENLKKELLDLGYNVNTLDINDKKAKIINSKIIYLSTGTFSSGFVDEDLKVVVMSEEDTFNPKNKKGVRKKNKGRAIKSFTDLKVGDYIVHEDHGIGIYEGVVNMNVMDVSKDYLKISYADASFLYVSIENLDLVQKYIGNDDKPPKINKLNGVEWKKSKEKVKKCVWELAEKLVKLYAERSSALGYEFSKDNDWQYKFEEEFPYVETNDQLIAIEDVKADMESCKVMDRLICGDVGYGKTEVAIRAAFKAVQDGKQVALLAPTTILVEQHYKTFKERMKNYPVEIEYISRFRTQKKNKEVIEELKRGKVDIIIGTHKLLSNGVEFKDLGLIIIDEEQRFGVLQKEKLKNMNVNVDTIAMSATPIPRTLHMSLSGIRDISLLEEAPKERKPVQTYVIEKNNGLIKNAIYKEVGRGGQVFYLCNRVKNIVSTTSNLRKLMPEIKFEYAHGQMNKSDIERIMHEFVNGEIDVLVATVIIETGIDIPNVNTMIIEDADRMGLSQLYQLKGRVGRSSRSAYAYLTYESSKVLSEVADKRLAAIKEFAELGSGFKIAMKDLEIRGAGNLLGSQQHGHLASVGYDMYCKLLEEAVSELNGKEVVKKNDPKIELMVDAYMPEDYISDSYQKVDVYKKIAYVENKDELEELIDEITDRFGKIPIPTENLMYITLIKNYAKELNVTLVKQNSDFLVFVFDSNIQIDGVYKDRIVELIKKNSDRMNLKLSDETKMTYKMSKNEIKDGRQLLITLKLLFESIILGKEFVCAKFKCQGKIK